jgi:two-component system sensor histidine kinase MtrB
VVSAIGSTPRERPVRRLGLRSSVTAGFALGALVLSAALAVGTYLSARQLLIDQRERTATRQAFIDAALVRDALLTSDAVVSDVLGSISPPPGTVLYVRRGDEWYSSSLDPAADDVTSVVSPAVEDGSVGLGWTGRTDPSSVIVGVPLPAVDAEYYEASVAAELDETLETLRIALAAGAVLTIVAGALLGRFASRRVLTPMTDVATAAARISGGDLTTRLPDTDDPELVPLVAAFNNMVDALDERIEQDARFAADVAHELRTPVTTLTTSLSLLQRATDLSPRSEQAVALMSAELRRFTRALEDLLTLGRLDSAAHERHVSTIRAEELVRQALGSSGRDPALLRDSDEESRAARVSVDLPQLRRALINLFDNADIHGGGLARCRVVARAETVDLHVEDHGPGIAVEDRERVFERFARAGSRKEGTGSGLGLSIVAQTVRNHGGSVWCGEADGGGATLVLRLPRSPEEPS